MSQVSSDHLRESAKTPAAFSVRSAPDKLPRPGWPEIVVGLVVLGAVAVAVALLAGRLDRGPVVGSEYYSNGNTR